MKQVLEKPPLIVIQNLLHNNVNLLLKFSDRRLEIDENDASSENASHESLSKEKLEKLEIHKV